MYLANWLYGSNEAVFSLFFRPLPMWPRRSRWCSSRSRLRFGETAYYLWLRDAPPWMPSVARRWVGLLLPVAVPGSTTRYPALLFDWRFLVWRGAMFVPFALLVGLALRTGSPRVCSLI
jgi:hypothetical protein